MMADALDQNGAAKVYILGRRLDKLEEVAKAAVSTFLPRYLSFHTFAVNLQIVPEKRLHGSHSSGCNLD